MKKKEKSTLEKVAKKLDINEILIPTLDGEEWKPLRTDLYPEIADYYYISNKNRAYNMKSKSFLKVSHPKDITAENCYWRVTLNVRGRSNNSQQYSMHRLMMSVFRPCVNMKNLVINHIDGVKLNNNLDNLEWTTTQGNVIHARDHGLLHPRYGEKHPDAKITEEQALEVIKALRSKKYQSYKYVGKATGVTTTTVADIARKISWKHLTKDIPSKELRTGFGSPNKLTYPMIHEICRYFQNNPKTKNTSMRKYAIAALNYANYDKEYTEGIYNSVREIYNRRRFSEISSQYNF